MFNVNQISKKNWFYVIIESRMRIPYIWVLLNWTAHPKPIHKFECSHNKTKSMKCPYFPHWFQPTLWVPISIFHFTFILGVTFRDYNTCQVVFGKINMFMGDGHYFRFETLARLPSTKYGIRVYPNEPLGAKGPLLVGEEVRKKVGT